MDPSSRHEKFTTANLRNGHCPVDVECRRSCQQSECDIDEMNATTWTRGLTGRAVAVRPPRERVQGRRYLAPKNGDVGPDGQSSVPRRSASLGHATRGGSRLLVHHRRRRTRTQRLRTFIYLRALQQNDVISWMRNANK